MRDSWDRRIHRAETLARACTAERALLTFYARLLAGQRTVCSCLDEARPSGSFDRDVSVVRRAASTLLHTVMQVGPGRLADEARTIIEMDELADEVLRDYWREPSYNQFFPKAILQPYCEWLRHAGLRPGARLGAPADNRCPFCVGVPQVSILDTSDASTEATGRRLLCATCLGTWPFRRVVCPQCGEENERKLGYYRTAAIDHLRVDACDGCGYYIKCVDLDRLGVAVPIVDEVAGAALDVWAVERGYRKIELNLVGL